MVQVKAKDGESVERLLRRFTKSVQQSGILIRAKNGRFYQPPKNKRQVRVSAIRRAKRRSQIEYLLKTGKIDEQQLRTRGAVRFRS